MNLEFDRGFPDDRVKLFTTDDALPVEDTCVEPLLTAASSSGSVELGGVSVTAALIFDEDDAVLFERRLLRECALRSCSASSGMSLIMNASGGSNSGSSTASTSSTGSDTRLLAMMWDRADESLLGTEMMLTGTSPFSDTFSWSSCSTLRQ